MNKPKNPPTQQTRVVRKTSVAQCSLILKFTTNTFQFSAKVLHLQMKVIFILTAASYIPSLQSAADTLIWIQT